MRGIEIGTDHRTKHLAQTKQIGHVIGPLPTMHFECKLCDTALWRHLKHLFPIRNETFLELPFLGYLAFRWPGTHNPVRQKITFPPLGQTRHGTDLGDTQIARQPDRLVQILTLFAINRMKRITVYIEGNDFKTPAFKSLHEGLPGCGASPQKRQIDMRGVRPSTRIDLHPRNTESDGLIQHVVERECPEAV